MSAFRIKPIDPALAHRVRSTLLDPIYGLPVRVEPAMGYGPCRTCLRTFAAGKRRIFFLYNPFSDEQDADLAGPVFIHFDECATYGEPTAFPPQVAALPLELRAYDRERRCIAQVTPVAATVLDELDALFASDAVDVVHVRNAEAKCFIARVERAAAGVR